MEELQKLAFEESVLIEDRKIGDYIDFLREKCDRVLVNFYVGGTQKDIIQTNQHMSVDPILMSHARDGVLTLNLSHSACEDLYISNGFVSGSLRSGGKKVEFFIPRGYVLTIGEGNFSMFGASTISDDVIIGEPSKKEVEKTPEPPKVESGSSNIVNLFGGKK